MKSEVVLAFNGFRHKKNSFIIEIPVWSNYYSDTILFLTYISFPLVGENLISGVVNLYPLFPGAQELALIGFYPKTLLQ